MTLKSEFVPLELDQLHREAAVCKAEGWRFIETHAANGEDGVDLYYAFMKDGLARNYRIAGVKKDQAVPSITDLFLAAFVFENEARELFGVDMRDIAIDFAGAMYAPAVSEPMTFISPEQKAAREKAAKAAAAKAAKEAAAASGDTAPAAAPAAAGGFVMTPERQARLDAKMATMSPEKRAKVEAALAARAAEAGASAGSSASAASTGSSASATSPGPSAPAPQGALRSEASQPSLRPPASAGATASGLDADATSSGSSADATATAGGSDASANAGSPGAGGAASSGGGSYKEDSPASMFADEQLESLLGLMDGEKAAAVREALNVKGGE